MSLESDNIIKKIIITCGLISGAIVSILLLVQLPQFEKGVLNMDNGMLTWDGYYTFVGSDFLEAWQQGQLANMIKNGASEAELATARKEQMEMGELYRNNFFVRFGFTLTEIIPVGLIITLVSSGLLCNNRFMPAEK